MTEQKPTQTQRVIANIQAQRNQALDNLADVAAYNAALVAANEEAVEAIKNLLAQVEELKNKIDELEGPHLP